VSSSLLNHYSRVFIGFQNNTQSFHYMTLSSLLVYVAFVDAHQGNNDVMPIFLPTTKAYMELENSMKELTCNTYIVMSNLQSIESRVIQSNEDVHVCGCMWWIYMVANLILFLVTCG
jgi:hypothetical protein